MYTLINGRRPPTSAAIVLLATVLVGCGGSAGTEAAGADDAGPTSAKTEAAAASTATPTSTDSDPSSGPDEDALTYQVPPNGGGFSTEPLDQPDPLPSLLWPGQEDVCEWLTPELAQDAGGTGEYVPTTSGCQLILGGGERAQVGLIGPYSFVTEPTHFMRPVTIAGLEARERALSSEGEKDCTVQVNTRSVTAFHVSVWNEQGGDSGSRKQRCRAARTAAEALAKRFVPLAGGEPWAKLAQQPGPNAGEGEDPCYIVQGSAAVYGGLDPESGTAGTDPLGATCSYTSAGDQSMTVLVTDGPDQGLAELPPQLPGAEMSDRRLGTLPARQEEAGEKCALSVEFVPGRVFTITYEIGVLDASCRFAEVVAASAVSALINRSTG